jgi:hypothetical protein
MQPQQTPRVRIEELPPIEQLTEEETAAIFGAGRARLGIEALESRELMASSLTANLTGGVLRVEGTPGADQIRVLQANNQLQLQGVTIQVGQASQASVPTSSVNRIEIAPLGGNDAVWLGDQTNKLQVPATITTGVAGDSLYFQGNPTALVPPANALKVVERTDGSSFTLDGAGWISLNGQQTWSGARDIAIDQNQTVFALFQDGRIQQLKPGGSWQVIDLGGTVTQMALAGDGSLYALNASNHTVYQWSGSQWQAVTGNNIQQIAVDSRVYEYTGEPVLRARWSEAI